jgi:hypothetical protein
MDIETIGKYIGVTSGAFAILGGLVKAISYFKRSKIGVTAPRNIGIVVSVSGTTPSIHLPLIISNDGKKEGIVTNMLLQFSSANGDTHYNFEYGLIWKQDDKGNRVPEKGAIPIPIPGLTSVETNIQFDSNDTVSWRPQVYEGNLYVNIKGKRNATKAFSFFIHPKEDRCKAWYSGPYAAGAWIENIPTFQSQTEALK